MNLPRHLANHNRLHRVSPGVWIKDPDAVFGYSDGKEEESYIAQAITQATDRGSLSTELASQIRDWSSEYHLSPLRSNLLRALNLDSRGPVLEIGAGCGAITRYLGELSLDVDAVEGSYDRACIARLRCADLENVEVHAINVNDLSLPDSHYGLVCFIGVLEYAQRFSGIEQSPEEAVIHLLTKAKQALRPGGAIVVAIENRLGFKYLFGAGEDHYGRAYEGIHDYPNFEGIKTYSKSAWTALLSEHGLTHEFLYPFPDYKLPEQVLSDHYIEMHPESWGHLTTINSRDYHGLMTDPGDIPFWETVGQAGNLGDFSNSFLIVASATPNTVDQIVARDFIHVSGMRRKHSLRTVTEKFRGQSTIKKTTLDPDPERVPSEILLHRTPYQEPFYSGLPLACHWERKLRVNPSEAALFELIQPYFKFVESSISEAEHPGQLVDLTPMNIMVASDGSFKAFDQEWETTVPVSPAFILFRGLFYFTQSRKSVFARVYQNDPEISLQQIILRCFSYVGLTQQHSLTAHTTNEELIQESVAADRRLLTTEDFLQQPIYADKQTARLYWTAPGEAFTTSASQSTLVTLGNERQILRFRLPRDIKLPITLRLHPGEEIGYLRLFSITTTCHDNSNVEPLHSLVGGKEIAAGTALTGLIYGSDYERDIFATVDNNVHLTWSVPTNQNRRPGSLVVTVELDWIRSAEFRLIRGALLERQAKLVRQAERFKAESVLVADMRRELILIHQSRVMRVARLLKRLLPRFVIQLIQKSHEPARLSASDHTPPASLSTRSDSTATTSKGHPSIQSRNQEIVAQAEIDLIENAPTPVNSPLISILMPVFNSHAPWLEHAINSVQRQSYENWELCIVNDHSDDNTLQKILEGFSSPRVHVRRLEKRANIAGATNEALRMASGSYISFLDHDDLLTSNALHEVANAISHSNADIIYSDEDFIDLDGNLTQPHFKPDYSPDLLLAHNYITHFVAIRRNLCESLGGLRSGYDGAQDYDLLLRLTDQADRTVFHIPKILYHWRKSEQSTSLNPSAKPLAENNARRALNETLERRQISATVESAGRPHYFHVHRNTQPELVSIIIPFKDQPGLLRGCIDAIHKKTIHPDYEIIGISNNSDSPETFALMEELRTRDSRVTFLEHNTPFNFSSLINLGVTNASGSQIVSLNNDVEIISWDWLDAFLSQSQRDDVGVVGGKLYFPDNTIQHAGIILGINGYAGHSHKGRNCMDDGYFQRASLIQNISAVTGAFMMFSREVFEKVDGFDETFPIACNDVDFGLRARELGYVNIFTPYAKAYHHESATRGYEDTLEKQVRFDADVKRLRHRHPGIFQTGDPYYNVNLSLHSEQFELRDGQQRFYKRSENNGPG